MIGNAFSRSAGLAFVLALMAPTAVFPAEPKGVRLRPNARAVDASGQPETEPVLMPWGQTLDAFNVRWPTNAPQEARWPRCFPSLAHGRVAIVACRQPENWLIDFGDDSFLPDVSLRFHASKFYEFEVDMSAERGYTLVYGVMQDALGQPTKKASELKQNAYGAAFESNTVLWQLPRVTVTLSRRTLNVDEANLTVTYRPLAPAEPKRDARAPF